MRKAHPSKRSASRSPGSFRQMVTRAFCRTSSARPGSRRILRATPNSVSLTWCTRSANAAWSPERARSPRSRSISPWAWATPPFDGVLPMMRGRFLGIVRRNDVLFVGEAKLRCRRLVAAGLRQDDAGEDQRAAEQLDRGQRFAEEESGEGDRP